MALSYGSLMLWARQANGSFVAAKVCLLCPMRTLHTTHRLLLCARRSGQHSGHDQAHEEEAARQALAEENLAARQPISRVESRKRAAQVAGGQVTALRMCD